MSDSPSKSTSGTANDPNAAAHPRAATIFDESNTEVVAAYSQALAAAAEAGGPAALDDVLDELAAVQAEVFEKSPSFTALLNSPLVQPSEKDDLLRRAFEGKLSVVALNTLRVMNRHGRIGLFAAVVAEAASIRDRRRNRRAVIVRTAVPLEGPLLDAVRERLAVLLQADPIVRCEVDASLLGGLVVQVGDLVYDASLRGRLEQLRHRLIEGKTHEIQSRRDHFSHSA